MLCVVRLANTCLTIAISCTDKRDERLLHLVASKHTEFQKVLLHPLADLHVTIQVSRNYTRAHHIDHMACSTA